MSYRRLSNLSCGHQPSLSQLRIRKEATKPKGRPRSSKVLMYMFPIRLSLGQVKENWWWKIE